MEDMTENDRKLIAKALKTDYIDWMTIIPMVEEAETIHAKMKLSDILKAMYHREEFFANNL